ncbi:MAG: zinc-ribbon domain-containing protein [Oscillospiraceae bacterium]
MNCPKCNYKNADNALYCSSCGTKLEAACETSPATDKLPTVDNIQNTNVESQPSAPLYPNGGTPQQPTAPTFPTYTQPQSQPPANTCAPNTYYSYSPLQREGQNRDWAAIASLVCGILSLPCCITVYGGIILAICAIVFGILGLKSSKKSMSIVGLCFGVVGAVISIIMLISVISVMQDPEFMDSFMEEFNRVENSMTV